MRNAFAVTVFVAALAAAGGCSGDKPKPDQAFLMPAPGIDEEGRIDHFIDVDRNIMSSYLSDGPMSPQAERFFAGHPEPWIIDVTNAEGEPYDPGAASRFRGHLVWGHESRSFTECGGEREGWVINQAGEDSRIRVTLQQRRCVDTMSGARFAWAATVDIDGRQLTGCAAEGL